MSYAGDITPQQAWELLREHPDAVLVDVRTDAEWRYVGVPDTSSIDRRTVLIEWVSYPTGARNQSFVDQLVEAGVTGGVDVDGTVGTADGESVRPVIFLCRSGQRSIGAATAATAAGIGPSYNVLDGFEGGLGGDGRRGTSGWRAVGLPWTQS
ncbi:rhodanese-like domain-containing protein [Prescottella agglutinans]|uniref:Rhodanese-related sulfurtransferase n=1 Tax=Prescottella agglutinans TaxID=1644129 RepID=A0ABT6M3D2_9NOCA|nr:rhodanese-like domain-containing protein [Prescottella agglutinans]MDH6278798.1 rhodanese-related sulfurtransferase [Prescottella agglutinans]